MFLLLLMIEYNTKVICTYYLDDVFLPTDEVTDNEKMYIRDLLYRQELLNIFDLVEFNEKYVAKTLQKLYQHIKVNKELLECSRLLANEVMSEDPEIGFCCLYSFDYMHITHICVSQYLEKGSIDEELILKLKTEIAKNSRM
jgi:hypothetical protein